MALDLATTTACQKQLQARRIERSNHMQQRTFIDFRSIGIIRNRQHPDLSNVGLILAYSSPKSGGKMQFISLDISQSIIIAGRKVPTAIGFTWEIIRIKIAREQKGIFPIENKIVNIEDGRMGSLKLMSPQAISASQTLAYLQTFLDILQGCETKSSGPMGQAHTIQVALDQFQSLIQAYMPYSEVETTEEDLQAFLLKLRAQKDKEMRQARSYPINLANLRTTLRNHNTWFFPSNFHILASASVAGKTTHLLALDAEHDILWAASKTRANESPEYRSIGFRIEADERGFPIKHQIAAALATHAQKTTFQIGPIQETKTDEAVTGFLNILAKAKEGQITSPHVIAQIESLVRAHLPIPPFVV